MLQKALSASGRVLKPKTARAVLGSYGEEIAVRYLQGLGYRVEAKNVRIGRDEIDIIAYDPRERVMVFVEVKTRMTFNVHFPPEITANWRKRRALVRAVHRWVGHRNYQGYYRMDLICIAAGKVMQHMKELEGM